MADVPTANGIKAAMIYTYNSQRLVWVFHFTNGAPATLANLQALATYLQGWDNTYIKPFRVTTSNWVKCETRALDGPGSPVWDLVPVVNQLGTAGGVGFPAFTALCIRHTTGLGGRSYRGRTYACMFPTAAAATVDTMSTGVAASWTTAFNQLRIGAAAIGFTFVVNSMYSGVDSNGRAIPRSFGVMTPIIASEAGIGFDTNRHRKLKDVI